MLLILYVLASMLEIMISVITFGLFSFGGSGLGLLGPSIGVLWTDRGQRSTVHVVRTPCKNQHVWLNVR